NANIGIALIGFQDASPFTFVDQNNDVGGLSAVTGNTIINYGGGTGTVNAAAAVKTLAQYNLNLSYNQINNNTGAGINHNYDLYGMQIQPATSANVSVNNNTISIKGGGSARQLFCISNAAGSTATTNSITISNNLMTACSYSAVNTGSFFGIYNTGSPASVIITNNTFTNSSSYATDGVYINIFNNSTSPSVDILNNAIGNLSLTVGGSTGVNLTGVSTSGGISGGTLSINSNSIQ